MIALLQRVSEASVHVDDETSGTRLTGAIGTGILALVAVEKGDTEAQADRLLQRIVNYRIFEDETGRMNLDLQQVGGQLLLVSQFTLSADTRKGLRPGFSAAMPPEQAEQLYDYMLAQLQARHARVGAGIFGADMQVSLVNDGPVTFLLEA